MLTDENLNKYGKQKLQNEADSRLIVLEESIKRLQDKLDRTVVEKVKLADDLQNCRVQSRIVEEKLVNAEIQRNEF